MQKVANKKCIRNLSRRTLRTAKIRNIIAVLAIALTTMMFTSVIAIGLSINQSFQEQNFRQAGGDCHGSFKDISREQLEKLKGDPLIQEWGSRRILGMAENEPFLKSQVEVSYMDAANAAHSFCEPKVGRLPKEGTKEAATDTRVLKLLGVEPKIGEEFTITYSLGVAKDHTPLLTETFVLSGWWEYDEAVAANNVVVPNSYIEQILQGYSSSGKGDVTGNWVLNVHFKNARQIEKNINRVLENQGYQSENQNEENYIDIGVNWGYTSAQIDRNMDMGSILGVSLAFLLITLSGYLIIYNIFRISVSGDIRFYGLLKTIGTTGKQIRKIIHRQALLLSFMGIPLGLLAGWLIATVLTPVVMSTLSYRRITMSVSPVIFLAAAAFALGTVWISCLKPSKLAGRVSPIEAVRYTEGGRGRRKEKRTERGGRLYRMALANLGRSKSKTGLVVLSMALAVLLLNGTYIFTNGFDMNKYLRHWVSTDFILGHADYFRFNFGNSNQGVSEKMIADVGGQKGVTESGRIYGQTTMVNHYVTEEQFRYSYSPYYADEDALNAVVDEAEKNQQGLLADRIALYGMEQFPLSQLTVLEGSLDGLDTGETIAAVVLVDDYGKPMEDSQHYQVGDEVEIQYVDEFSYIDSRTGETAAEQTPEKYMELSYGKVHKKTYTVGARVTMLSSLGYRYFGAEQMILSAEEFKKETGSDTVMTYIFDAGDEAEAAINEYLKEYTQQIEPAYDFESKEFYVSEFESFRSMFLLMGSALSLIVGIIAILNYINAVATSVISRKREFAVLQAVGMTGKQLKMLLMMEGCMYGACAILLAFLLNLLLMPSLSDVLERMFWFFSYKFTFGPILTMIPVFLLLGIVIPLVAYRFLNRQSVVVRMRETE